MKKIILNIFLFSSFLVLIFGFYSILNQSQNLFKISAQADPSVPDHFNDTSKIANYTNLVISGGQVKLATYNCWGLAGACDPGCKYSSVTSKSYYTDPGCSGSCPVAGTFYVPSGTCSGTGSGSCYKMGQSGNYYTSCSQGSDCEGHCWGGWGSCSGFDYYECMDCPGCEWSYSRNKCEGDYDCFGAGKDSCETCPDCHWSPDKWYWSLGGLTSGYASYQTCSWLTLYYTGGTLASVNLLSGISNVGPITSFSYNAASLPSGTTLRFQFSKDNSNWYNSAGTLNGWDTATVTGGATINLSGLGWYGPKFYYRAQFLANSAQTATPVLESIAVNYDNTVISITVNPSSFNYGTMGMSQPKRATEVNPPGSNGIAVTNNSNVPVDLAIRGANAQQVGGGATWTLSNTIGNNQYTHQYTTNISNPTWTFLTLTNQSLFSSLPINQTRYFDLRITLPSSMTTGIQMRAPITIVATQAP